MTLERWIGVFAGLGGGIILLLYMYGPGLRVPHLEIPDFAAWFGGADRQLQAPATPPGPPAPSLGDTSIEEQVPQYPVFIPEVPVAVAVAARAPDLAASDDTVRAEISRAVGGPAEVFLVPRRVIQNIVATIDSLDREPVPMRFRAIVEVPGQTVVETRQERQYLSGDNDERYRLLVVALGSGGTAVAQLYLRWYPLFQRAYREMGYPGAHFNDRLIEVIDHLLETPEVSWPIELVRPAVLYEFADPQLEQLSSGQKVIIRIGPANAQAVKARLREVRAVISAGARDGAAPRLAE
ncbi:MAG TPA: DUF3014 domain-containing protein [Verrucomicrobiae bacterium]|nr:DUF3014 domain-containing protein [Verrucomicrobiae bacterium]